jgi:DNA-binding CsgD family transcriptional regulator/tetratricopeptide (TPR) repeat protein
METATKTFTVEKRLALSDAKQAYFQGDFDRCLTLCGDLRIASVATASEVALLMARAYLRTGRPAEAETVLVRARAAHVGLDASLTSQMLMATARIRQGDVDAGIVMLGEAAARSADAHLAIRSEIAFSTALGYWSKRDLDTAESFLAQVDPDTDIIHARALELQAWCSTARRDYRRAAQFFQQTLIRLDTCRASDVAITVTAISTLAIYAAELFDRDFARFVETYVPRIDWSSGLTIQRYLTLAHLALFEEFSGNTVDAYRLAMQACDVAPTAPFAILGWALCSGIARNAGETSAAIALAKRAQAQLATIDIAELTGEERFALMSVAENCAHFDPDGAASLFAAYWGLAPVDRMLSLAGDPRLSADETFIAGVVAQAGGDLGRAAICYRRAFEMFKEIGYVRRGVTAAYALISLVPDDEPAQSYARTQLIGTSNYITRGLERLPMNRPAAFDRHPIIASLPKTQREVVALICSGKTNKEIAALRNVGEQTIKNMLSKYVFRKFGVTSRSALISACLREASGE